MAQISQVLPSEIAEVYEPLYQDICWLHSKWQVFCQLYADGKENVDLMNISAPSFFSICQETLVNDVLLTISRLTDPHQTFKRDNLSLEQLVNRVDKLKYPALKTEVNTLLDEAMNKCSFARTLRHKRIAHNDLPTKLKVNPDPLPKVNRDKIEDALSAIRKVMNRIESYFQGGSVAYEYTSMPSDGKAILARLREAKEYRFQKRLSDL